MWEPRQVDSGGEHESSEWAGLRASEFTKSKTQDDISQTFLQIFLHKLLQSANCEKSNPLTKQPTVQVILGCKK